MSPSEKDTLPVFRVLRGDPEDAELAALVAVFGALASTAPPPTTPARSVWSSRAPETWRTSILP